ncbi:MAG: T9SS type A sorting domain-containing protein [Alphaproteobacteria bacterium]|nr:T9SS type A sorting domain-containing protein [Alphaproteobacteria bacterium]
MVSKFFLVVSVLGILSCEIFSQTTFFKWVPTNDHETSYDVIQTNNGQYIVVGEKGKTTDSVHACILRFDQTGSLLEERIYGSANEISQFRTINSFNDSTDNYLIAGSKDSVTSTGVKSYLSLCVINNSLDILTKKLIPVPLGRKNTPWKVQFGPENSFYLLSWYDTLAPFDFIVMKFNFSFDTLGSFHIPSTFPWYAGQDLIFNKQTNELKVYYLGAELDKPVERQNSAMQIITLDQDLNILFHRPGPVPVITNASVAPINDSLVFVAATDYGDLTLPEDHFGCYKLTNKDSLMFSDQFYIHKDTTLYTGRGGHSLSIDSSRQKVYIAGAYNVDANFIFPWQQKPSWIHLLTANIEMTNKKSSLFGGDAFYFPYCMKSTSDGGVIVTGLRYDYHPPGVQQCDIFLLKTDTSGQIQSIPGPDLTPLKASFLAPNPGKTWIKVILGSHYPSFDLKLFDLSGQLLFSKKGESSFPLFEFPNVSKGIYFYLIESENKIIGRGKWIKE